MTESLEQKPLSVMFVIFKLIVTTHMRLRHRQASEFGRGFSSHEEEFGSLT
jgi:hypothetical protein